LSLGSNIEPQKNIPAALELLSREVGVEQVSTAWWTPAVGSDGPNFLNAAVRIRTDYPSEVLKKRVLRKIEEELGRVRTRDKYAPRTIDLDILIYDGIEFEKRIWTLAFLAVPLAEILPDYQNRDTGESLAEAAERLKKLPGMYPSSEVQLRLP
jgi:2-amino-4-hydroxy-6-hydroxymethyldihydropteridine diphosphokinase